MLIRKKCFNKAYWIFPTYSARYEKQVFLDAFSSKHMVNWKKHHAIIDTSIIKWAKRAIWAPVIVKKDKHYFLFFSANDIQSRQGNKWLMTPSVELGLQLKVGNAFDCHTLQMISPYYETPSGHPHPARASLLVWKHRPPVHHLQAQ